MYEVKQTVDWTLLGGETAERCCVPNSISWEGQDASEKKLSITTNSRPFWVAVEQPLQSRKLETHQEQSPQAPTAIELTVTEEDNVNPAGGQEELFQGEDSLDEAPVARRRDVCATHLPGYRTMR